MSGSSHAGPSEAQSGSAETQRSWPLETFIANDKRGGLMTDALQRAIDTAADTGGGVVSVPAGQFTVGTIHLRSGVKLELQEGAILRGSENLADYPMPEIGFIDAVGQQRGRCLVSVCGVSQASIVGPGIIDGSGAAFTGDAYAGRPFLVRCVGSSRVQLKNLTLRNAGAWVCHLEQCDDVLVDGVTITSRVNHNNDGIDIDSCADVVVRNCDINTGDDAICIKSTAAKRCERVCVERCRLTSACGAIKIGTETYGDIRDITVRDCRVYDTGLCAIKIISTDGAELTRIHIHDIEITDTTGPIFIRLGDRCRTYKPGAPPRPAGRISDITLERIRATVSVPADAVRTPWTGVLEPPAAFSGIVMTGLPQRPLNNVSFRHVSIRFEGGYQSAQHPGRSTEPSNEYPEHFYFGVLPAWACYVRHVDGLHLEAVDFSCRMPDRRPQLNCDDVDNFAIADDIIAQRSASPCNESSAAG
ncbi:MAG: glycoside hydrolase family 28 protein [Tepidisphaeraceae bacterium]